MSLFASFKRERPHPPSSTTIVRMPDVSYARASCRRLMAVVLSLLVSIGLVGCGDSSYEAPIKPSSFVATAKVSKVPIHDAPNSTKVGQRLSNPDIYGQPLTFLVLE